MEGVTVDLRRPVAVKVIMTAQFRDQLMSEARDTIARIDRNLEILSGQTAALTPQHEADREKMTALKAQLEWRMREVEGVEDGAELPFRSYESSVSVRVGDNFLQKMGQAEIVLRDWEVVEIRAQ